MFTRRCYLCPVINIMHFLYKSYCLETCNRAINVIEMSLTAPKSTLYWKYWRFRVCLDYHEQKIYSHYPFRFSSTLFSSRLTFQNCLQIKHKNKWKKGWTIVLKNMRTIYWVSNKKTNLETHVHYRTTTLALIQ